MFRAMLWSQWRESRLAMVVLAGIAVAVPLLSLRGAGAVTDPWSSWDLLRATAQWGAAYPILALAAALALAVGAWWPDHRTKHVYALTLPISRVRYLLLRYGAGLTLLLAIAGVLAVSTLVATMRVPLPPLLHAYPAGITTRFVFAGISAYTILFAFSGLTPRMARLIAAVFLLLVLVSIVADLASLGWNPLATVADALLSPYSPLAIFRARWMLIDV
jgi:hypothetical protein